MHLTGLIVFALTYVLISLRRLQWLGFDRPAGALLGAVACVVLGVLTPEQALKAVDGATLVLLFGVMGMGAFLALDGFFSRMEETMVRVARTPQALLGVLIWGAGLMSALITNDAVCVLGAPLVVAMVQRHRLPPLPYLLGLATAANTGSVATLVGNPQNMLCAVLGELSFADHLLRAGPLAVAALAINHALLRWVFRKALAGAPALAPPPETGPLPLRSKATLAVIFGTVVAYTAGAHLAWAATAGFVALMLLHRTDTRQLWARIDWSILLFFAGLFVVVEALIHSGAPARLFERAPLASFTGDAWGTFGLSAFFLLGANVVSNVPFILVVQTEMATLSNPTFGWELLAVASTFAGNLTLLGSVANVIVAESAREVGGIGFFDYLKVGLPLAVITTALGAAWLGWLML